MNNINNGTQSTPIENKQSNSAGAIDLRTTKRNSGLFSFFKWFKNPTTSKESVNSDSSSSSSSSSSSRSSLNSSGSVESVNSTYSTGTVASFSFVSPDAYRNHHVTQKSIVPGPETDTYKARLKQREKNREKDKNVTLRKKYNLFFNRDTLLNKPPATAEEDNSKSLPLMTKKTAEEERDRLHRRTASESSKIRKAGAYCHVKGKRKAPQPPNNSSKEDTLSLRRKKRSAPAPPGEKTEKHVRDMEQEQSRKTNFDVDVICNDSLKLDHGILKSAKEEQQLQQQPLQIDINLSPNSARSSYIETPVSPRPWYKRSNVATTSTSTKKDKQNEPVEKLPDVQYARNNELNIEETKIERKKDDKRKSGISFLTNISELDREATELLKKEKTSSDATVSEIPAFMRPKPEQIVNSNNTMDTLVAPNKRKSAKDLIAKFNAITNNVGKVTVNPFQFKDKKDYFGGKSSKIQQQETKKSSGNVKKNSNELIQGNPLMKSESASVIKANKSDVKETPKVDRKSWYCPKCYLENEYWRIICHVCSTIKPYFDDLSSPPNTKNTNNALEGKENKKSDVKIQQQKPQHQFQSSEFIERNLERSKTQIGFSAFARYNSSNTEQTVKKTDKIASSTEDKVNDSSTTNTKKEEREKLIKMLIEMKNSLPKRKTNSVSGNKENKRASVIEEGLEALESENKIKDSKKIPVKEEVKGAERKEQDEPQKKNVIKNSDVTAENKTVLEEIKMDFANIELFNNQKVVEKEDKNGSPTNNKQVGLLKIASEVKKDLVETEKEVNKNNIVAQKNNNKITIAARGVVSKLGKEGILHKKEPENIKIKNSDKPQKGKVEKDKPVIVKEEIKQNVFKSKAESISFSGISKDKKPSENISNNKKEVIVVTQKTIYENIKVNKDEIQKPAKVSTSAQTSAVIRKTPSVTGAIKKDGSFELMRPKDFADIYNEKMGKASPSDEHLYANLGATSINMSVFVNIPKNFSDLKNSLGVTGALANNTDTLEINRLLRRLETAIAKGELTDAAVFARELAQLKVNCSVIRQKENKLNQKKGTEFTINMFVEDRLSHRGPFPIQVSPDETVGDLKKQVEKDFEIPINVQRWILGKELATDDKSTLKDHHVTTNGSPAFLYLVAPNRDSKPPTDTTKEQTGNVTKNEFTIEENLNITKNQQNHSTKDTSLDLKSKTEIRKTEQLNKSNENLSKPSTSQQVQQPKNTKDIKQEESISITVVEKSSLDGGGNAACRKSSTIDEDLDEYDCKTLKPQRTKDWECRMCTLLNPSSSNICAVCATVRQKDQSTPTRPAKRKAPQPKTKNESKALHLQLLDLDNNDLVSNTEAFECMVCLMEIGSGEGVTLRECLHQFCKECLAYTVEFTDDAEIKCPYRDDQYSCDIALQDREIKALVAPNIYEQYLARSVTQVENKIEKSFHCKTPDCKGWCIFEDNVNEFRCPVCRNLNCLTCQAIHTGMNCKQYQEKMNAESDVDEDAKRTREMLEEMVDKGEALTCPACQVILMKKWGCDWVRCSMCKTEICWVTRGPRWGPAGKGDTSGGCKCGVNGIKCHAQCNYCH